MTPSLSDYTNGAQTSSLVLESVSSQDYGDYVCTAENICSHDPRIESS